jgi:hypothetical protein
LELNESALRTTQIKKMSTMHLGFSTGNDYKRASGGDAIAFSSGTDKFKKKSPFKYFDISIELKKN